MKLKILLVVLVFGHALYSQNSINSYIVTLKDSKSMPAILANPDEISIKPAILNTGKKELFDRIQSLAPESRLLLDKLINYQVVTFKGNIDLSRINSIQASPHVISFSPNFLFKIDQTNIPNDPRYSEQWALSTLDAINSWKTSTGKKVRVGVVDTGIDFGHEDLKNRLWINPKEDINQNGRFDNWASTKIINGISGDLNGIDEDGNGYTDDIIGYDFVDQSLANIGDALNHDAVPFDEQGHGTSVSGVIAAEANNNIGTAGLAYNAELVTLRALDATGNGESDDIASAIVYAALNGVQVLNFSFGEAYDSPILHDAIKFAASMGCVIVASSGNNGWDKKHYPSDYEETISVGATNPDNERHYFSNYGSRIHLMAPGLSILTTKVGDEYQLMNGTSFSAPYVAAAAALLLEVQPELKPQEIKGILQVSATDIGDPGWDIYTASGLVNPVVALNESGKSIFQVTSPEHNSRILWNKDSVYSIIGTIYSPLLSDYSVSIGSGIDPTKWKVLNAPVSVNVINDTLASFKLDSLSSITNTIRISVNFKNGNTLEKRFYIDFINPDSALKILDTDIIFPYSNGRRVCLINSRANMPARFVVKIDNDEIPALTQNEKYTNECSILIDINTLRGLRKNVDIMAIIEGIDTAFYKTAINFPSETFPEDRFAIKNYSLPPAYLDNQAEKLYSDGKSIVVNKDNQGSWGKLFTYNFEDGKFIAKDSLNNSLIPAGMGDSNGDGIPEILAFQSGKTFLYQSNTPGGNPFGKILFSESTSLNLWAAGMYDIDRDGRPDIVSYSDTSFIVYSEKSGRYSLIGIATPENKRYKYISTFPGYAWGNFDSDPNIELAHSSQRGNLFIYEYTDGRFRQEFTDTTGMTDGNQFMTAADLDNDGIMEIIHMNYSNQYFDKESESTNLLWQINILKNSGQDSYQTIYREFIYGVRAGAGYRNGISSGNVDTEPGDEIIITAFPNSYILKWDNTVSKLKPLWWYPQSYSNAAIIEDFDSNGKKELGFSTGFETLFFEFTGLGNSPTLPTNFDGWALNENQAYLRWDTSADAKSYEVYLLVSPTRAEFIDEVSSASILINGLGNNELYRYVIRAKNNDLQNIYSEWSQPVEVFTHTPVKPLTANALDQIQISLKFSGKLKYGDYLPDLFHLIGNSRDITPATAQVAADSSIIITLISGIPPGDYKLKISSFPDFYKTPTDTADLNLRINESLDPDELYLTYLEVTGGHNLKLTFSEAVDPISASNPLNYTLHPWGSVLSIKATDYPDVFDITLDPATKTGALGVNYTLTAINIKASSGKDITKGPGNTLGFTFSSEDINSAFVYPNPVKLSSEEKVMFANIPDDSEVSIMTLEGELLRNLNETDGNGGVEWDCLDSKGKKLSPGVYLFKVKKLGTDESISGFYKFAIIE